MKKFPFLLLDAGPIIKLFELDIWDEFIKKCDVTISRIVAHQAGRVGAELGICIRLEAYEKQELITILPVETSIVKTFYDNFDQLYKAVIHPGEKETLAFLCASSENWGVCSADHAVFRVLGLLNKADQGVSLEEILKAIGLGPVSDWEKLTPQDKDWKYTKKFREKWTRKGQIDSVQDRGLL